MRRGQWEALSRIDTDRVSVEDVQSLFWFMPRFFAQWVLNTGVRRGEFRRNEDGTYHFQGC